MHEIVSAAVTTIPPTIMAALAVRNARRVRTSAEEVERIVRGNGMGDICQMQEETLKWIRSHQNRHSLLDDRISSIESRLP